MPQPNYEGIYWGDDDWFRSHDFRWFPDQVFKGRNWQIGELGDQSVKLLHKISERVSIKPDIYEAVGQASAVYTARVLKKNELAQNHLIVKIFMRIPHIPLKLRQRCVDKHDLAARRPPIVEDLSDNECFYYEREYQMLEYLTRSNCSSTPRYIANFQHNESNPWVRDGFLCFVVMTKVPGRKVSDFWMTEPDTPAQRREQVQIQQAFKKALVEVARLGVILIDAASRNIMWDSEKSKCYLIDFENSEYKDDYRPTCWENLAPRMAQPDRTLVRWDLWTAELLESLSKEEKKNRSASPRSVLDISESIRSRSPSQSPRPGPSRPRERSEDVRNKSPRPDPTTPDTKRDQKSI